MKATIHARFTPDALDTVARRYGLAPTELTELDGYESFIFETPDDRVLRVGHSSRRSEELIHGEVDWIEHLATNGVRVARPLPSAGGRLVEVVADGAGASFLATAFARAPGEPSSQSRWDEAFAHRYGALLGRMHRLAMGYEPANPQWRRPEWDSPVMLDMHDDLPSDQPEVQRAWDATLATVASADLERTRDTHGLIHQDAHGGNFFVDAEGEITLFDFDDSAYSWFVNDLAIVIFYAVSTLADPDEFAAWFFPALLAGYAEQHQLPANHLAMIPTFMRLRELDTYAIIYRDGEEASDHPWVRAYLNGRRERIEAGVFPAHLPGYPTRA